MAIRSDVAGDTIYRTANLPDYNATYTMMGWFYRIGDTNAVTHLLSLFSGATSYDLLATNTDGTTLALYIFSPGITVAGSTLPANTWTHLAMVRESSTSFKAYLNGVLDITVTNDVGTSRTAATRMEVMATSIASTRLYNGRVAGLKVWDSSLTQVEIQQEMHTLPPRRFSNLNLWTPAFSGSGERTRDYSGNGRDWTEGGTLTDEDGPPVSWGAPAWHIIRPVGAGAPATSGTALMGLSARLVGVGVKAASQTASARASGLWLPSSASARSTASTVSALARLAIQAAKAATGTAETRAVGLAASAGSKASTATANEQAPARLAALVTTARSAVALLAALARQVASSVPALSEAATLAGRAWMAASGVKGGLSASAQVGSGRVAATGVRAATGQASIAAQARAASVTQRDAFAIAVMRSQPGLAVLAVAGRTGSGALYVQGRGAVVIGAAVVADERGTVEGYTVLVYDLTPALVGAGSVDGGVV